MGVLYYPPTVNGLQKTLDAQLDQGTTAALTLNNTTNVPNEPGVIVVNRIDADGNVKSASEREYITYTGTSGATLTGLTRAIAGSTDQDHAVGSVVEFIIDRTWGQAVIDALANLVDPDDIDTLATAIVTLTGTQTLTNKTLTSPAMTTPSVTSGDVKLATGLNIQVNNVDPWRTISLPAKSWSPTTTAGCAGPTKVEAGTNDIDYDVLDFDASSDERAYINFPMPASYDGGVIQFRVFWTNAAGETADTIEIELSGRSLGNDEAIDQANGTAVAVTDTWIAQNDVHITDWSGDVTLAGTPAGNEYVHLEILRDVSGDDLAGDLRVIAVQIRYRQGQFSD